MLKNLSIRNKIWLTLSIPLLIIIITTIVFTLGMNSVVGGMRTTIYEQGIKALT